MDRRACMMFSVDGILAGWNGGGRRMMYDMRRFNNLIAYDNMFGWWKEAGRREETIYNNPISSPFRSRVAVVYLDVLL